MRTPAPGPLVIALVVALAGASLFATTTVTVADGDTLTAIAARHDVRTADLVEWNEIDDPDRIFVGDVLRLTAPGAEIRHVVTAGDTLTLIAGRYGETVAAIAAANELADVDLIRVGQTLTIGGPSPAPSVESAPGDDETDAADPDADLESTTHVVQAGETLFSIARRYGVPLRAVAAANGIEDPSRIRSGVRLTIPGDETEPADPPPAEAAESTEPDDDPVEDALAPDLDDATADDATADETTPDDEATEPTENDEPAETGSDPAPAAPPVDDTSAAAMADAFDLWSISYGLDQGLLEAIAEYATGWRPNTIGPDGRVGIAQLTEAQVELIETRLLGRDLDPLDAADGVRLAARYLRYTQDRTDTELDALMAFRQGLTSFLADGPTADAEAFALAVVNIRDQRS